MSSNMKKKSVPFMAVRKFVVDCTAAKDTAGSLHAKDRPDEGQTKGKSLSSYSIFMVCLILGGVRCWRKHRKQHQPALNAERHGWKHQV